MRTFLAKYSTAMLAAPALALALTPSCNSIGAASTNIGPNTSSYFLIISHEHARSEYFWFPADFSADSTRGRSLGQMSLEAAISAVGGYRSAYAVDYERLSCCSLGILGTEDFLKRNWPTTATPIDSALRSIRRDVGEMSAILDVHADDFVVQSHGVHHFVKVWKVDADVCRCGPSVPNGVNATIGRLDTVVILKKVRSYASLPDSQLNRWRSEVRRAIEAGLSD